MRNWAQPPARRRAGLKAQIEAQIEAQLEAQLEAQMKAQRWARGLVPLLACLLPAAGGGRPQADASSKSVPQARKCGLGALAGLAYLRRATPHETCPRLAARPGPQPFTARR